MKIVYSKEFVKSAKKIPKNIKKKFVNLLEILEENPFHPQLHTKPLAGNLRGYFSFRITREWRVIFCFLQGDTIFLIDVAHRKNIYKK